MGLNMNDKLEIKVNQIFKINGTEQEHDKHLSVVLKKVRCTDFHEFLVEQYILLACRLFRSAKTNNNKNNMEIWQRLREKAYIYFV